MGFHRLSSVLWRERQLLELLLFKLEVEQLLLASGTVRWLGHATREVETVLDQIRDCELGRSVETEGVAAELHLDPNSSLEQLAQAAPVPWGDLLEEHRAAFLSLTTEIASLASSNRELLATSQRAAQETIMALTETVQTYDSSGSTGQRSGSASLIDQTL